MEHLRSRRLRSSVDLSKKKATAHEHGMHPFGILSISDMFLLSCMGDPYSKKKERQESPGLDCSCNFHFSNRCVYTEKALLIHIRIYLRERLKKKERGRTVGVWDTLVKHSMAIQHVYFFVNANGEISPGEMKLKRRSFS